MATYTFTGANGDPLPAGLTAQNGTFEIQNNKLEATSPNPGGPLWVCTQPSTADGNTVATINLEGTASNTTGVVFRYSNNDNFWMAVINGLSGQLVLFDRTAGTFTNRGSYTIPSFSASTDYVINAIYSGTSIDIELDSVSRITLTDSFNQTETLAGLRFGKKVTPLMN